MSDSLNQNDRREAKNLITQFFSQVIKELQNSNSVGKDQIMKKYFEKKKADYSLYKKFLKKREELDELEETIKKSINMKTPYWEEDLISLSSKDTVDEKEVSRLHKDKQKSLAKLQTIETRKQLADLFEKIGL
jgi:hypothetical protein